MYLYSINNPMNFIIKYISSYKNSIKHYFRSTPLILGRWTRDNCQTKTNKKVDWANEDHCGPCGVMTPVYKTHKKSPK